jgi:hypothetical protein
MITRFLFFALIFAIGFAIIGKWVYLLFLKYKAKEKRKFEEIYEDIEYEYKRCRNIKTHNIQNLKNDSVCKWCGMTAKEIKEKHRKRSFSKVNK